MQFRKIAGPLTCRSNNNGTEQETPLPSSGGGRFCKDVQYMVVVTDESGDNARCGIKLYQGPDRQHWDLHSTPIALSDPGPIDGLLVGDTAGSTNMIGEYLEPRVIVSDSASTTEQWVKVEVWEMRKPF